MSKLLLDEHPLTVMPQLAKKIGLNEAIIIQQIHYWNEINKKSGNNYRDGHYWTFNSITQWQEQFPFWSKNTIQRTITNLEKLKLITVGNYNKLKIDRTKWYRINYEVVSTLEQSPFTQIGVTNISKWLEHLTKLGLPLPEINSENNSKNNIKRYIITCNDVYVLNYYSKRFKDKFGKDHPTITGEQLEDVESFVETMSNEYAIDIDHWEEIIDQYFDELSTKNNGSVLAFASGDYTTGPLMRYIL